MKSKHVVTLMVILVFTISLKAQHVNIGIYGGANIIALTGNLKDYHNAAKAKTTPVYGTKISLDVERLQIGVGFNNWLLEYNQPPETIHQLPFMYGDYNGFRTTLKFNMYQFIINYKLQKAPSYFYTGLNFSYFDLEKNVIDASPHTIPTIQELKATKTNSGMMYGIQGGYNLNLINNLSVQLEMNIRYLPLRLRTMEIISNPPFYPSEIKGKYDRETIISIPLSFGINYNF